MCADWEIDVISVMQLTIDQILLLFCSNERAEKGNDGRMGKIQAIYSNCVV